MDRSLGNFFNIPEPILYFINRVTQTLQRRGDASRKWDIIVIINYN